MDKKLIPYEKMSKKHKREMDRKKRNTWNGFNPVTRKPENPKAYKRKQALKFDVYPQYWTKEPVLGVML